VRLQIALAVIGITLAGIPITGRSRLLASWDPWNSPARIEAGCVGLCFEPFPAFAPEPARNLTPQSLVIPDDQHEEKAQWYADLKRYELTRTGC